MIIIVLPSSPGGGAVSGCRVGAGIWSQVRLACRVGERVAVKGAFREDAGRGCVGESERSHFTDRLLTSHLLTCLVTGDQDSA